MSNKKSFQDMSKDELILKLEVALQDKCDLEKACTVYLEKISALELSKSKLSADLGNAVSRGGGIVTFG